MADNVSVGGLSYATDEVGGAHYQRVKVVSGADGTVNDVSTSNPLATSQQGPVDVNVITSIAQDTLLDYFFIIEGTGDEAVTTEVTTAEYPFSLSADGTIAAAPGAGYALWVLQGFMQATDAQAVCELKAGAAGAVKAYTHPGANGGLVIPFSRRPWIKLPENTALYLNASFSSGSVSGLFICATVPV